MITNLTDTPMSDSVIETVFAQIFLNDMFMTEGRFSTHYLTALDRTALEEGVTNFAVVIKPEPQWKRVMHEDQAFDNVLETDGQTYRPICPLCDRQIIPDSTNSVGVKTEQGMLCLHKTCYLNSGASLDHPVLPVMEDY